MFSHTSTQQRCKADPSSQAPMLERLEDRALLAGNVIGVVSHGVLTLTGDLGDNDIIIDQPAPLAEQQFRVTGTTGTTINGNPSAVFNVVTKDIVYKGGEGNDTVLFDDVDVFRDIKVSGGNGNNGVTINNSRVLGRVKVVNGLGLDTFSLAGGSRIDHNVRLNNKAGGSATDLNNSIILWDLTVKSKAGADTLNIGNVSLVNRYVRALVGTGGSGTVVDNSGITGRLIVKAGRGGVDAVDLSDATQAISRGAIVKSGGFVSFQADNVRFDDNVRVQGKTGLDFDAVDSYFAFRLALLGGAGTATDVTLDTCTVNGKTLFRTDGGNDSVTLEDSVFNQKVFMNLGRGNDTVEMEQLGTTPVTTDFARLLTIVFGDGDDTLSMGYSVDPNNQVVFAGPSVFKGGLGVNTRTLPENVLYAVPPVFKNMA